MSLAHLTLPTRDVEGSARFFEQTLGWKRTSAPANSPVELVWLQIGPRQQVHIIKVDDFQVSPFEREFGRHFAVFHPRKGFDALKSKVKELGGTVTEAIRPTPFDRFFFTDPNGYAFEVIAEEQYIPE
jgi:predicted enzyme related to lactoylglutathione lyase